MKSVIVTGGAKGIGAATVRRLAEDGYGVIINYKSSKAQSEALEKELTEKGFSVHAVQADASVYHDAGRLVAICESYYGSVNALVNNAGVSYMGLLEQTDDEKWNYVMDNNAKACYNMCRAASSALRDSSGGIINISSMWGVCGASGESAYSASKSAVIGITRSLAKEMSLSGVRVNCVAPGFILTDMNAHLSEDDIAEIVEKTPLGRAGTPEDIAEAVAFLLSDKASFITGQTLVIDGGFIL